MNTIDKAVGEFEKNLAEYRSLQTRLSEFEGRFGAALAALKASNETAGAPTITGDWNFPFEKDSVKGKATKLMLKHGPMKIKDLADRLEKNYQHLATLFANDVRLNEKSVFVRTAPGTYGVAGR